MLMTLARSSRVLLILISSSADCVNQADFRLSLFCRCGRSFATPLPSPPISVVPDHSRVVHRSASIFNTNIRKNPNFNSSVSRSSCLFCCPTSMTNTTGSASNGSFTVSHTNRPPMTASGMSFTTSTSGSQNSLSNDDLAREESLRRQKEELACERQARQQAFVERHEDAIVSSVPLEVRLRCLLAEGRRYERYLATRRRDEPADVKVQRMHYIDAGYKNLIEDVRRRSAVIAAHNPPAPHQHALGSEAIGCYSSMLPWTEGVVSAEVVPDSPVTEAASSSIDFSMSGAAPGAISLPPPRGRKMHRLPPSIKHRAASAGPAAGRADYEGDAASRPYRSVTPEPSSRYRWTIPQRLATDTRKLAAVTASRRKRLQTLSSRSSSFDGGFMPASNCRAPCTVAAA
jgi:hypothetical protein